MSNVIIPQPIHISYQDRNINTKPFPSDWMGIPNTDINQQNYDAINKYHGIWYLAPQNDHMVICETGNSIKYDVIENPNIISFEESTLEHCNIIRQSSGGGRYFIGKAFITPRHTSKNNVNPAISKFHSFLIYHEDKLKQFYRDQNPKNFYFDIETTGLKPIEHIILSIGGCIDTGKVMTIDFRDLLSSKELSRINFAPKNPIMLEAEKHMIKGFLSAIDKSDPDTLIGYYSWAFDIPFIISRAKYHKLDHELMALFRFPFIFHNPIYSFEHTNRETQKEIRDTLLYLADMTKDVPDNKHFDFGGRLHIDIMHHFVTRDLSLKPPKTMKSVGRHYKLHNTFPIFDDVGRSDMFNEYINRLEEARMYLASDLLLTRGLYIMYRPRNNIMINDNPYSMYGFLVAKKTSGLAYMYGKELINKGYIIGSSSSNVNPARIIIQNKYEGAITGKQNIGWKRLSFKRDVTSYYPNLMISFNLGMTNTLIDRIRPYTGNSEFIRYDNKPYNHIICPDINNKVDYRIRIYKEACPVVELLLNQFKQRLKLKKGSAQAYKTGDFVLGSILDGQQQAVKTDINSSYGGTGSSSGMSNIGTAIGVVSTAKTILNYMIHTIIEVTGDPNIVNEADTDGVMFGKNISIESINAFVDNFVRCTNVASASTVTLTVENFDLTVIHAIKNYHFKEDGKVVTKGSSLGNKNMSPIVKFIKEELFIKHQMSENLDLILPQHLFNEQAKELIYNVEQNGFSMYVKTVQNNKSLNKYPETNYIKKLGEQWESLNNSKLRLNTTLQYVHVQQKIAMLLYDGSNLELLKDGTYTLNLAKYYEEYKTTQRMG